MNWLSEGYGIHTICLSNGLNKCGVPLGLIVWLSEGMGFLIVWLSGCLAGTGAQGIWWAGCLIGIVYLPTAGWIAWQVLCHNLVWQAADTVAWDFWLSDCLTVWTSDRNWFTSCLMLIPYKKAIYHDCLWCQSTWGHPSLLKLLPTYPCPQLLLCNPP